MQSLTARPAHAAPRPCCLGVHLYVRAPAFLSALFTMYVTFYFSAQLNRLFSIHFQYILVGLPTTLGQAVPGDPVEFRSQLSDILSSGSGSRAEAYNTHTPQPSRSDMPLGAPPCQIGQTSTVRIVSCREGCAHSGIAWRALVSAASELCVATGQSCMCKPHGTPYIYTSMHTTWYGIRHVFTVRILHEGVSIIVLYIISTNWSILQRGMST